MKIEIYKSGLIRPSWKWRLKARNGKILASGRGFNSKRNCEESIELIKEYFKNN